MDKETSEPYRVVFILIRRFWSEYFQSQAPTKHLLLQAWLKYSFEGMCRKKSLLKLCFDKKPCLVAKSFSFQSHSFFPANSETIQCEGRSEKGPRKLWSVLVLVYIPDICHFFYTGKIFGEKNLHQKTPIFCVKSVKTPLFCVKSVENANFSR